MSTLSPDEMRSAWKDFQADCKADPFIQESYCGYYNEYVPVRFKKRDSKFYVTVKLTSILEQERTRFQKWLREKSNKYGWKPHLTSGGMGSYTYRVNGDL